MFHVIHKSSSIDSITKHYNQLIHYRFNQSLFIRLLSQSLNTNQSLLNTNQSSLDQSSLSIILSSIQYSYSLLSYYDDIRLPINHSIKTRNQSNQSRKIKSTSYYLLPLNVYNQLNLLLLHSLCICLDQSITTNQSLESPIDDYILISFTSNQWKNISQWICIVLCNSLCDSIDSSLSINVMINHLLININHIITSTTSNRQQALVIVFKGILIDLHGFINSECVDGGLLGVHVCD